MPAPVDAAALGRFALLDGVALDVRQELLRTAEDRELPPGEVLIRQNLPSERAYLILSGRVGVFLEALDAEPVAILGPGATVGELGMLDKNLASASVVSLEPTRVLALDETCFWRLINDSHSFAINLLIQLVERLRANNVKVSRNVEERRHFERAALFDGLTGVHNRRWLDEVLHRLVGRYRQSPGHLSLALGDIDHFKQFNDRHGHHAGDQVLVMVARTMASNLRPTDLVARFGGEEFVMIFPDTPLDDATEAAERVRAAVAREPAQMPDGTFLPAVTLSIGVAELHSDQPLPDFLLRADQAMYRAKAKGRNRVERERVAEPH
ncbi:MAG: GGDEF domain-containing protein [Deltaproteobacteria bacterium]|nr:GGDEF domain-containing protein [Deltaproteobacteria bacterium]